MGQFALHRDGSRPVAEARAQPDFFILRPQYRSVEAGGVRIPDAPDPREDAAPRLPPFFRDGQSIPEGIDVARVVFIRRVLIDPLERGEEQLPEMPIEDEAEPERVKRFDQPRVYQNLAII